MHFECSDVIELCDGIIFKFYTGLPYMELYRWKVTVVAHYYNSEFTYRNCSKIAVI